VEVKSDIQMYASSSKFNVTTTSCYNAALHLPKLLQHVHIQQPVYKTEEDLNHANSNTNYLKENLSLCTSGSIMGGGIAPHILNLGTTWRRVVSFTSTINGHYKCLFCCCDLYSVADNYSGFHIWEDVGNYASCGPTFCVFCFQKLHPAYLVLGCEFNAPDALSI